MSTSTLRTTPDATTESLHSSGQAAPVAAEAVEAALLTGGIDKHYAYGLAMSLVANGVRLDIVGGAEVDDPEMHSTPGLNYLNLLKKRADASVMKKVTMLLADYFRLIAYAWNSRPKIFHVLWNYRMEWFDRTVLTLYYKALGKKVVLTAHNVNRARRDGRDSVMNRLSLKIQYRLADQIFVHTEKMKDELVKDYGVAGEAVTVIPYGINNAVPGVELSATEAKHRLGISSFEKTMLFFGNLRPSKGVDWLLAAFEQLRARDGYYRLIVAGQPIKGYNNYWERIRVTMQRLERSGSLVLRSEFIPDQDIALYFAAADVVILPYTEIFQSGVLFLAYNFGLPVVATDVGSLREDIVEGRTGFICRPNDADSLASAIEKYFESDLFKELDDRKQEIRHYASLRHSWTEVGEITQAVYQRLCLNRPESRQPQSAG